MIVATTRKTDTHQAIMDRAYAKWQANTNWSKEAFWMNIDAIELEAVATGNLVYQVQNGGFMQWIMNGYAEPISFMTIRRVMTRLGTETAKKVMEMLDEVEPVAKQDFDRMSDPDYEAYYDELSKIDSRFYKIDHQLLVELNDYFQKQCN